MRGRVGENLIWVAALRLPYVLLSLTAAFVGERAVAGMHFSIIYIRCRDSSYRNLKL
jgi:predicted nuclease of predicted toxin-antitoxin system